MDIFTNTMPLSLLVVENPALYGELLRWEGDFEFWSPSGWCKTSDSAEKNSALVWRAVKTPVRIESWANIYDHGPGKNYPSRQKALENRVPAGCLGLIHISYNDDGTEFNCTVEFV